MLLIRLEEYKNFFKSDEAYHEFVRVFRDALSGDSMPMVVADEDIFFTAVSSESTKQILCDRILKRFGENPALIDELRDRLENDDIVD
jgi:hypothetical protein